MSSQNPTCGTPSCNSNTIITPEIAAAIDEAAQHAAGLVSAVLRVACNIAAQCTAPARGVGETKDRDLTGAEVDRHFGWSSAHRRRLGLKPTRFAGDEERNPRYDLDDVRRQLDERGPQATKSAPKKTIPNDDVDVSSALSASGLRAISGGRGAR